MKTFSHFLILVCPALGCAKQELETVSDETIVLESAKVNPFFEKSFDAALDRSPVFQSYLGRNKNDMIPMINVIDHRLSLR